MSDERENDVSRAWNAAITEDKQRFLWSFTKIKPRRVPARKAVERASYAYQRRLTQREQVDFFNYLEKSSGRRNAYKVKDASAFEAVEKEIDDFLAKITNEAAEGELQTKMIAQHYAKQTCKRISGLSDDEQRRFEIEFDAKEKRHIGHEK